MTYKRYLLSVLLLGITANVFCNGPDVTIEQVENQIVQLMREKIEGEQTLKKIEFGFQMLKKVSQLAIDNAGPKIKKEANSWIEEIENREPHDSDSFRKFIGEILDRMSGKSLDQISDQMSDEEMATGRKILRDSVQVIEVLSRKFGTCLDNPENSVDHCLNLLGFVAAQLDRDIQLVDYIQEGARSIFDLQEEILKKKLTRLE